MTFRWEIVPCSSVSIDSMTILTLVNGPVIMLVLDIIFGSDDDPVVARIRARVVYWLRSGLVSPIMESYRGFVTSWLERLEKRLENL